jgi:hypothetical protein
MSDPDPTRHMIEGMLESVADEDMSGLSHDALQKAMSHPLAAETVRELMPIEAASVQPGEPAPDFDLPYMPPRGGRVTLSSHFGKRPVALIFGSYT